MNNFKTYEIQLFTNNLIGKKYTTHELLVYMYDNIIIDSFRNFIAIEVDAYTFKESVFLNNAFIDPLYMDQIMKVDKSLSENDNPILLIGIPRSLDFK